MSPYQMPMPMLAPKSLSGPGPRRECVACGVHTCQPGSCRNCGGRLERIGSQETSAVAAR